VRESGDFRAPRAGLPQGNRNRAVPLAINTAVASDPLNPRMPPRTRFLNDRLTRPVDRVLGAPWALGGVHGARSG
jgi:hypothetical protein